MKIETSTNYNQFDVITGNRIISPKKVERIKNDINKGLNLLPYCPIIVYKDGDKLMIVDGQHRFEVSKEIESPIYYVVTDVLTLQQIAMLNSRQDKWTSTDFLNCFVKIGIKDYITLKDLLKTYKISITTGTELLMNGKVMMKSDTPEKFRNGEFTIRHLSDTVELLKLSHSLFDVYNFYTDRNLISAVQQIKKKGLCDFKVLNEKIDRAPMLMDRQGTVKDYIYNIEKVYNHKNSIRQVIF